LNILSVPSNELENAHPLLDRQWGVIVVMPLTDAAMAERSARLMAARSGVTNGLILLVTDADGEGFVRVANMAFERTQSEFFAYVAQDAFAGRLWLARAIEKMQTTGKHLLGFNDGKWMGVLAAFGLARRSWVLSQYGGAFFYPAYDTHFADAELTILAMNEQCYCYEPNSVLVEVDWEKDDATTNAEDRQCFHERVIQKFGGKVQKEELLALFA